MFSETKLTVAGPTCKYSEHSFEAVTPALWVCQKDQQPTHSNSHIAVGGPREYIEATTTENSRKRTYEGELKTEAVVVPSSSSAQQETVKCDVLLETPRYIVKRVPKFDYIKEPFVDTQLVCGPIISHTKTVMR